MTARRFGWLCMAAWLASLLLPVKWSEVSGSLIGANVLLFGWISVLQGHVAWLANLGFFGVFGLLVAKSRPRFWVDFLVAASTAILAISAFRWNGSVDEFEAAQIWAVHYQSGFYLWVAAIVVASAGLIGVALQNNRRKS